MLAIEGVAEVIFKLLSFARLVKEASYCYNK